jgi:hypothetical protein
MNLAGAFDRLEAFCSVQLAERGGFTPEAVALLQQAIGLDEEGRRVLSKRLPALADGHPDAVLLGVLLGAFASQS